MTLLLESVLWLAAIFGGLSLGIVGVKWLIYWRHKRAEARYEGVPQAHHGQSGCAPSSRG